MSRSVVRRWRTEQLVQSGRSLESGPAGRTWETRPRYAHAVRATLSYEDAAWRDVARNLLSEGFKRTRLLESAMGAYGVEVTVLSIDEPPGLRSRSCVFYGPYAIDEPPHHASLKLVSLNPDWKRVRAIVRATLDEWAAISQAVGVR